MKKLFIEARASQEIVLPDKLLNELPSRILLATTVQYIKELVEIKKQLEKAGKKVELFKPVKAKYPGQMLGCDHFYGNESSISSSQAKNADAFLFIGDGLFHPKAFLIKNDRPVFAYSPGSDDFEKLTRKDVDSMLRKQKGALSKFHSSDTIGIITSLKQGQSVPDAVLKNIEQKYNDKKFYIFVADTIDFSELENFPFIECWVNTACPRIAYDESGKIAKPVVNISDIM